MVAGGTFEVVASVGAVFVGRNQLHELVGLTPITRPQERGASVDCQWNVDPVLWVDGDGTREDLP